MRFGPLLVKRCDACLGLFEQPTVLSGNTLRARYWTDGKMEAPMLPAMPQIVKCPHCKALVWPEDLEPVTRLTHPEDPARPPHTRSYLTLTLGDYYDALETENLEADKEHYLRVQAWWKGNDKRRDANVLGTLLEKEQKNLRALAPLLDLDNLSERLMAAEIQRELGQFEQCFELLKDVLGGNMAEAVITIAGLARERDPFVRELVYEDLRRA